MVSKRKARREGSIKREIWGENREASENERVILIRGQGSLKKRGGRSVDDVLESAWKNYWKVGKETRNKTVART